MLAADREARLDKPPFDASAMDGYAVRAADVGEAPATLTLIGEAGAGKPFTGRSAKARRYAFSPARRAGGRRRRCHSGRRRRRRDKHHDPRSGDARRQCPTERPGLRQGRRLLDRGRRLTARDILLAAASGEPTLPVIRKPVVALLSTGDELVMPGTPLAHGQISASNSLGLAAVVEAAGGEPRVLDIARDTHKSLAKSLAGAEGADVLVTIGGASVGDHDLVRPALEKAGAKLEFYKIAMRPGKPLFFGMREIAGMHQHCLGLPGNPVASLICARVFLVPLIGRMLGREVPFETVDAVLGEPLAANGPREHYMRARLDLGFSPPRVTPFKNQDSGLITALQRADCLVIIPTDAPAQTTGTPVKVLKLDI